MNSTLRIDLTVNANTEKAKQSLASLISELDKLSTSGSQFSVGQTISKDLSSAQIEAAKLSKILRDTVNVDTGKIDLTKFSDSLKQSNMNIQQVQKSLKAFGPQGDKAFTSLAQSIMKAEVPLKRTGTLVNNLWTTLKNTARWQLSSSILHGFMGSIQQATGYAKNLNESLNNIRIVTGQSVDQMARFADQANKAAKALSATTTEYTNASLIYYQQGLSDAEVKERTDITIKMANVARESAETISDQMTAVWNNFYNGSQSLEHYADAMTKLGAETASSTDEIALGLEKFAAVADTIGLSFDNAAAALATITATTRQSADVVGTALKTVFARIQSLKLGETLEDQTTLTSYSEALAKVGINIKDQNGQLKDMDILLDEMGHKWGTLQKDQQVALAQTVAGVRQYTQLIALMENFDFYQQNISSAKASDGTLDAQAKIYAESWEAARDRVKAATEDIFDSILNDEFFIDILNGFEKVLNGVSTFADALNGLPGVLSFLGVVVTRVFDTQLANAFDRMAFNIRSSFGITEQEVHDLQNEVSNLLNEMKKTSNSEGLKAEIDVLQKNLKLRREIAEMAKFASDADKASLNATLASTEGYENRVIQTARQKEQYQKDFDRATTVLDARVFQSTTDQDERKKRTKILNNAKGVADKKARSIMSGNFSYKQLMDSDITTYEDMGQISRHTLSSQVNSLKHSVEDAGLEGLSGAIDDLYGEFQKGRKSAVDFKRELSELYNPTVNLDEGVGALTDKLLELCGGYNISREDAENYARSLLGLKNSTEENDHATTEYEQHLKNVEERLKGAQAAVKTFGQNMVKGMQGISQITMGINSLISVFDTLNNQDLSFGEKFLQVTMSLSMTIPSLIMGINALREAELKESLVKMVQAGAARVQDLMTTKQTASTASLTGKIWGSTGAWIANKLAVQGVNKALASTIGAIGGVLIPLTAVAAVAAVLVGIFKYKQENSPEGKLKALEEAASKSADTFNELKTAAEEALNTINNFDSAVDKLDDLTKGTQAYADALKEANRQALDLIQNYKLVEGEDYYWDKGQIVIKEEAKNRITNEASQAADIAYAANQNLQNMENQARLDIEYTNSRDRSYEVYAERLSQEIYGKSRYDENGGIDTDQEEQLKKIYTEQYDLAMKAIYKDPSLLSSPDELEKLGISQVLVDALVANKEATLKSVDAMHANESATNTSNDLIAKQLAGEGYGESKSGEMALEGAGKIYSDIIKTSYDANMKKYIGESSFKEYAALAGIDQKKGFDYKRTKANGDVVYSYTDENGKTKRETVAREQIANMLATAEASDKFKTALDKLRDNITKINENKNLFGVSDFVSSGGFENSTLADFENLIDPSNKDTILNNKGFIAEATRQGYNTATELYDSMIAKANEMDRTVFNGVSSALQESMTFGMAQAFQNTAKSADDGQFYKVMIDSLYSAIDSSSLSAEDKQNALSQILNVDWTSWDAGKNAVNILSEYGIAIDITSENWNKLNNAVRDSFNAIPDLESMAEIFKEISKITKDLELGDILSKEDYKNLVNYNSALSKYFTILSDGTAMMIGDPLDIQQNIKDARKQELSDSIKQTNDRRGELITLNSIANRDSFIAASHTLGIDTGFKNTEQLMNEGMGIEDYWTEEKQKEFDEYRKNLNLEEQLSNLNAQTQATYNELALMAEDYNERQQMLAEGTINAQAASIAAIKAMNEEAWEGLDPIEVEEYAKSLQETMGIPAEQSEEVARAIMKMDKGVENLASNWESWGTTLRKVQEAQNDELKISKVYVDAMEGVKTSLSDILDVSEDFIDNDFIEQHLNDIAEAANGSADAIDRLNFALGKDIATDAFSNLLKDSSRFEQMFVNQGLEIDWLDITLKEIEDKIKNTNINAGNIIDTGELFGKMQSIVTNTQMTVEEANAFYRSMGFTPEFVTRTEPVPNYVTLTTKYQKTTELGNGERIITEEAMSEQKELGETTYLATAMGVTTLDGETTEVPIPQIKSMTANPGGKYNAQSKDISGTTKTHKPVEKERYHKNNKQREQLESKRNLNSTRKDLAFGKDKLQYIDNDIAYTEAEIALNEARYSEIQGYQTKDKTALDKALAKYGLTAEIENGVLQNWDYIMDEALKDYNEGMLDESKAQAAEERWENLQEAISNWEDTENEYLLYLEKKEELAAQKIAEELERITTSVEAEIELDQRSIDKLDYVVDKLNRGLHNTIEVLDALSQQTDLYVNQSKHYQQGIKDIYDNAAAQGRDKLTDDEQQQVWDYQDQLLDLNGKLLDIKDTFENAITTAWDEWNSEIDETMSRFDTFSSILDHYKNIIELSGRKTKDSALYIGLAAKQTDVAMSELSATQSKYVKDQAILTDIGLKRDQYKDDPNSEMYKYWDDQYKQAEKRVKESHDALLASWENTLQAAADEMETKIDITIQKLKDSISQYGLDNLSDRYEKSKEENSRYLSDLEKEYELNKLIRQVNRSIDEIDNLAAKQALNKLQEEYNAKLEKGVKLTQYDLEYMQKQYDVEMARLALEEAKNAKSTVRLSRDSEGNFGYVYTADQDKIDDAQQNYEDKLYELQDLSLKHIEELSDQIIQNEQDMAEALAAVDETAFDSKEEYYAELERISTYYLNRDKDLRNQLDTAVKNSGLTYRDTVLGQLENTDKAIDGNTKLKENTTSAMEEMQTAWQNWKDDTTTATATAGIKVDEFTSTVTEDMNDIGTAATTAAQIINTKTGEMVTDIGGVTTAVDGLKLKYTETVDSIIADNERLNGITLNSDGTFTVGDPTKKPDIKETDGKNDDSANDTTGDDGISGPGAGNPPKAITVGGKVNAGSATIYTSSYGEGGAKQYYANDPVYKVVKISGNYALVRHHTLSDKDGDTGWFKLSDLVAMKTGGYTGQWGSEGKLAFLHQKELVLNEGDTDNLLKTISFIRELVSMIDIQAAGASLVAMSAVGAHPGGGQKLEQQVSIQAEFPNVTDRYEIEEAFNSLVNRASQYANRKF